MSQDFFTYFIYTLLPIILISLALFDNRLSNIHSFRNESISYIIRLIIIFVFVFIVGLRFNVGRDYSGYASWYKEFIFSGKFPVDNDFGFVALNKFLFVLNAESFWLFVVLAFGQIYFLLKTTDSIKHLRPWVFFFYFTLLLFFTGMNAMRQTLAFLIFVYSISAYNNKNYLKFAMLALLGFSFHKTVLIPLVILPFVHYMWYGPRLIQFGILLMSSIILPSFVNPLIELVSPFINILGYDYYVENIDHIQEISEETRRGSGTSHVLFFLIDAIIIYFFNRLTDTYPTKFFKQFYGYFFIGLILSRLFANNFILSRVADYFIFFRVYILALLISIVFLKRDGALNKLFSQVLGLILIGLIAFYYRAIMNNAADVAPFKFIFS
jgi:hypothetical protein